MASYPASDTTDDRGVVGYTLTIDTSTMLRIYFSNRYFDYTATIDTSTMLRIYLSNRYFGYVLTIDTSTIP